MEPTTTAAQTVSRTVSSIPELATRAAIDTTRPAM
jgi:hypothetical protein